MLYDDLTFPPAPRDRPYVYINMVSTIDGKTINGERNESVIGLGSKFDQQVMDILESKADAILLGSGSVRANPKDWNPHCPIRIVVSSSGNLPWDTAFFTNGRAIVATPKDVAFDHPPSVKIKRFGSEKVDLTALLADLKQNLDIEILHGLGGSELNAQLFAANLVDELFLTVAPKIKLGRDLPTYAGGDPLPRDQMLQFSLIGHHAEDDEIFLRYRRKT